MRGRTIGWLMAGMLGVAGPAAAQGGGASPVSPEVRAQIIAVRDTAWRGWFAGQREVLAHLLPENFIGIGWGEGPWGNREETLQGSVAFAQGGGKLVRLEFPRTEIQLYGDAAVVLSQYLVEFENNGQRSTQTGRATELFVRRGKAWIHPSWHLDSGR